MLQELNYAAARYTFSNAKRLLEMSTATPTKLADGIGVSGVLRTTSLPI